MPKPPDVLVIGAGIAGLTAAHTLQKAGCAVRVLEARDHPGGRMVTVDWEGFRVDAGAKFVTTSDRSLLGLVREMGLEDKLVRSRQGLPITIYRDGKLHTANFLSIPSYFAWSGVSLPARLAMLKLLPHLLHLGRLPNPYHLERASGPDDDVTYEDFFKRKISDEMFEYWAIPMFETMCSYTGQDVSRKAFLAMMASYLNADTVTFAGGVGLLPERIAAGLNVELGATAKRIEMLPDDSGARLAYTDASGKPRTASAEKVVIAIPGRRVLPLFAEPRPAWSRFFPKVGYSISALQYHICQTDFQPGVVGTFIPRALQLPINSFGFEEYKEGRWLVLSDPSVYTFRLDEKDETLIGNAIEIATRVFPQLKGTFVAHRIFRWQEKVPTFRPGYLQALADFWAEPQEGPVYFCGDYFAGPSTGGALYTGLECAERVLAAPKA
jgi:oxygen-dependent protoporphyrinogen oxidase